MAGDRLSSKNHLSQKGRTLLPITMLLKFGIKTFK